MGSETGAGSSNAVPPPQGLVPALYLTPLGSCNPVSACWGQQGHQGIAMGGSPASLHAHVQGLCSTPVALEDGTCCVWSGVTLGPQARCQPGAGCGTAMSMGTPVSQGSGRLPAYLADLL